MHPGSAWGSFVPVSVSFVKGLALCCRTFPECLVIIIMMKGSNVHVTRFCLCCCCCNPSVRKSALLTRLSVWILHSPCLCVVSSRLLSRERSSLCACFRVTQFGPVLLSLSPTVSLESRGVPRGTGTSVLRVVAHDWRCDEESQPRCRESASLRITDPVSLEQ